MTGASATLVRPATPVGPTVPRRTSGTPDTLVRRVVLVGVLVDATWDTVQGASPAWDSAGSSSAPNSRGVKVVRSDDARWAMLL